MAEFKFSCPQCAQHIQCDTSYSGAQINCPACQQIIVVPPAPHSAAAPPAPPSLSTRRSTTTPAAGRRFPGAPGAQPPVQVKSHTLRNVLIISAAIVVLAALGGGGWHFYSKHKAKQEAAKGNPAAQVPPPTAAAAAGALNVLTRVQQAYTNLTSLSAEGTSVSVIDLSAVTAADMNPNQSASKKNTTRPPANLPKSMTNTTEVAIKLARPDLYRIEGNVKMVVGRMTNNMAIAIWSAGKGNFTLMDFHQKTIPATYMQVKDRNTAFGMTSQSGGLAMGIPQLFFDEAGQMGKLVKDWGQTDDESLNGQDCYTLTAKMLGQKLKIWVSKASCMILQSQITLGGPVGDADIDTAFDAFNNNTNQAQIAQGRAQAKQLAAMMTKIRGTVTETYDTIETNKAFADDDFNYPVPRGVKLTSSPFGAATLAP